MGSLSSRLERNKEEEHLSQEEGADGGEVEHGRERRRRYPLLRGTFLERSDLIAASIFEKYDFGDLRSDLQGKLLHSCTGT